MTEREKINNDYFNWILSLITGENYPDPSLYLKLLARLYDTQFIYTINKDENRADDGIYLRYRFSNEKNIQEFITKSLLDNKPCSVLEMMVALALRCEENIMIDDDEGMQIGRWFWGMIENLGLIDMLDSNFNKDHVDDVIQRFLRREYKSNGEGGLFTVKGSRDLRKAEIWYQLCWYLDTIL